jgi:hypothetical protein
MATTAHVVGAQFDWRRGLSEGIGNARGFYAVLAASIGLAVVLALTDVPVIVMLQAASVIGGLGTPAGLVLLVCLGRSLRNRELRRVGQSAVRNRPVDVERSAMRQPLPQRVQHVLLELRRCHRTQLVELHQDLDRRPRPAPRSWSESSPGKPSTHSR